MAEQFYKEVGRRLARRRAILRLRQQDVGHAIGSYASHISALERGTQLSLRLDQLHALAQVLQTSTDYLLLLVDEDPGTIPPYLSPEEVDSLVRESLPLGPTYL